MKSQIAPPLGAGPVGLALALTLIVGLGLRWEGREGLSLCHFDEGVQVASAQRMARQGALQFDYARELRSPPLFPWLVATAQAVLHGWEGAADMRPTLAIDISVVLGALTPLALFGLGRRIGGTALGLAAAALLAASDLHVAVSRTALTDASMTLWLTLAIWTAAELTPRPLSAGAVPRLSRCAFLGLLLGAWSSLAWTTQYGGALAPAVVIGALLWSSRSDHPELAGRRPYLSLAALLAAAVTLGTLAPWYWHLRTEHPEGVLGVWTQIRGELGDVRAWPEHAGRQLTALPALRHHGWLVTLGLLLIGAVVISWRARGWRRPAVSLACGVALWCATAAGGDALLLLCGVAGIAPALWSGRWSLTLAAIWLASLALIVPCWFPYVRLMTPAMPPAILLTLHLIWPARGESAARDSADPRAEQGKPGWPRSDALASDTASDTAGDTSGDPAMRFSPLPWVSAGLLATAGVALSHPFGLTPTRETWQSWSPRSGYAQLAERIRVETPANAAVICQGQPAMGVYCPRDWKAPFGNEPFTLGLGGLDDAHPTYLALDFRWLHEPRRQAGDEVLQWLDCLNPVAVVPFEPSLMMLLDHLPPALAAAKLHTLPLRSQWTDRTGRKVVVPPDLRTRGEDVLVLYEIDLLRIRTRDAP